MLKAYKYRIYPTDDQKNLFARFFGCCRLVFNWAIDIRKAAYEKDKSFVNYRELQDRMVHELKEEKPFLKEVNSQSLLCSLRNADTAYKNFFRNSKVGYPKFKNRKGRQSFQSPQHCEMDFENGAITIPKAGAIPAVLHRRFNGTIKTVTVSKEPAGTYFASVLVENGLPEPKPGKVVPEKTIGIDLGIKLIAICSDGRVFDNHKYLLESSALLNKYMKILSRRQEGSKNWEKARLKVAKIHAHIANQRKDNLHKITYLLTHDSQVSAICIEDLNVEGMTHNHKLARSIMDASFGMFAEMLEYKCRWYGIKLIKIDRFAPSSKTCSCCGYKYRDLKLSERSWTCPQCGAELDRDYNASVNIKNFGLSALPSERGEVTPAERPTVDDRLPDLRSSNSMSQEKVRVLEPDASAFRRK